MGPGFRRRWEDPVELGPWAMGEGQMEDGRIASALIHSLPASTAVRSV